MRQCAQIKIISVQIVRPFALRPFDLGLAQTRLYRADNTQRDFILKRKDVAQRVIIALSPDVSAGRRFNQLRGDAHAPARLA